MRRLTKIVASFVCVAVMLFGGGCGSSNQMDEIFQGNYVEVSEETVRDFMAHTDDVQDVLGELIRNNGGVSVRMTSIARLLLATEGKGLLNKDGTYRYMEEASGLMKMWVPTLLYRDGQYCYLQYEGAKRVHRYSNSYSCGFGQDSVGVGMINTYGNSRDVLEMDMLKRFYMDATDAEYIKIKGTYATIDMIWVYNKNYKLMAYNTNLGGQNIRVTPWNGTITPPDDLDRYVFEDQ